VKPITNTRRNVLEAGGIVLASALGIASSANAQTGAGASAEEIARRFYKAWEKKDWGQFDAILAENFTFSSANGDDHISKSAFKSDCWETQKSYIHHFDIEQLFAQGNEAFVKYLCHTTNGKTFRNIEYVRTRGEQIVVIECYFGGKSTFPSAVSTGRS
jgi:ketosteroid isomerase-like protein